MARGTRGARRGEGGEAAADRCPKIEAGYGTNPGDCACGACPEARGGEAGRETEALAGLLAVRLAAGSIREPRVRFDEPRGLSRDFMVGWSVVAAFVAHPDVTLRRAERFVAKESRALKGFGAEQAEYLRGLRAGLSAAVAR
jgi:hypothetical protein